MTDVRERLPQLPRIVQQHWAEYTAARLRRPRSGVVTFSADGAAATFDQGARCSSVGSRPTYFGNPGEPEELRRQRQRVHDLEQQNERERADLVTFREGQAAATQERIDAMVAMTPLGAQTLREKGRTPPATFSAAWGTPSSPEKIREMIELTPAGRNLMRQDKPKH